MAPLRFDRARIEAFLGLVVERLDGEWLLLDDGVVARSFAPARTTEDLDLIGLLGTQDERFALMELAAEAGLPIEAVNSAAAFFVRRIPSWRDELVVLTRGSRATIFRPTATLFLILKCNRLSAVDLDDCLALLAHGDEIDRARVRDALAALPATDDSELERRRTRLAAALTP